MNRSTEDLILGGIFGYLIGRLAHTVADAWKDEKEIKQKEAEENRKMREDFAKFGRRG